MKTEKLLSFHNDPKIKEEYLKRLQLHHDADEIVKGKYWENGKGCAVGCTVHSDSHDAYTTELGISWRLALVEDSIFENIPNDQAKQFPMQFLSSIPVGVDTDLAFKKFVLWNICDEKEGLLTVIKDEAQMDILIRVSDLYKQSYEREIKNEEWEAISIEANKSSAYASAYASASASAYAYASASASAYADRERIREERFLRMRDKLLEFLIELK